jgi:hypothetical protein
MTMSAASGIPSREAEVGGAEATVDRKTTMHADLDALCTVVYCTAVAQTIMGIPSDRRFLAVAKKHLRDLSPELPQQPGFHKRRACLAETIEWN